LPKDLVVIVKSCFNLGYDGLLRYLSQEVFAPFKNNVGYWSSVHHLTRILVPARYRYLPNSIFQNLLGRDTDGDEGHLGTVDTYAFVLAVCDVDFT
jgi:hypothetical protein